MNEFKTFLVNSHQMHPALLDPVTKRGEKRWQLDHLLLRSWMLQRTFFSPISCPDCFDEISSDLFSSLCRCIPAKLHFKSLLVCWFQSSPKSPIIQETDVLDYWDFFGGKQHRGWFCGSIFAPNPAEHVGSELEAAKKCLWNCFHGHCACGDRFVN